MNVDNIDKFGHCVVCHINLCTKKVIDGKVQDVFMPIHGHTTFLLNNGSKMQVCMCKPCQKSEDLDNTNTHCNIMDAVHKGWLLETKLLVSQGEWDQKKADKYLEEMNKRSINCHIEHLAHNVIENRIKELINVPN